MWNKEFYCEHHGRQMRPTLADSPQVCEKWIFKKSDSTKDWQCVARDVSKCSGQGNSLYVSFTHPNIVSLFDDIGFACQYCSSLSKFRFITSCPTLEDRVNLECQYCNNTQGPFYFVVQTDPRYKVEERHLTINYLLGIRPEDEQEDDYYEAEV